MKKQLILIVGDNKWLIKAVSLLVETEPSFSVIGVCTIQDSLTVARHIRPDVVLFLPGIDFESYQRALQQLHSTMPNVAAIVITVDETLPYEERYKAMNRYRFLSQVNLNAGLLPQMQEIAEFKGSNHRE